MAVRYTLPETARIASAKAGAGRKLSFATTAGEAYQTDLSGLIARLAALAPLDDPAVFRAVKVIDEGFAVGWPKGGPDAEMSAETLLRVARAQKPVTASAFKDFMTRHAVSVREAARVFEVDERTVKRWREAGAVLPTATGQFMRVMDDDETVLFARLSAPEKKGKAA
jgi:hypothetical protein